MDVYKILERDTFERAAETETVTYLLIIPVVLQLPSHKSEETVVPLFGLFSYGRPFSFIRAPYAVTLYQEGWRHLTQ